MSQETLPRMRKCFAVFSPWQTSVSCPVSHSFPQTVASLRKSGPSSNCWNMNTGEKCSITVLALKRSVPFSNCLSMIIAPYCYSLVVSLKRSGPSEKCWSMNTGEKYSYPPTLPPLPTNCCLSGELWSSLKLPKYEYKWEIILNLTTA